MRLTFYKYQGTGNDFIIVDDRQKELGNHSNEFVQKLCDRRLGIGADGFIVLRDHEEHDFEMIYHNADGSQSLCGNGSRCVVHLAQQLGMIDQEAYFLTTDGTHQAHIQNGLIHVKMHDVTEVRELLEGYWLDTGSPHYVTWVKGLDSMDVYQQGQKIRNSGPFQKEGVNVNFVQRKDDRTLAMRTYERGVEGETLSCGTGATAVALVASLEGSTSPVTIDARGGQLQVSFTKDSEQHFQNIYLIGPAQQVYQGTIDI
ncbi:MAG: diaminopimelate epimerase [Bacteroidota bacterium]